MKRLFLSVLLLAAGIIVNAQTYNVREIVAADRNKAAGCEGPYRFDAPSLTAAPKGYEAFYISHYGRHGSRYSWSEETYTTINKVLEAAMKSHALTDLGNKFYNVYKSFYLVPYMNTGDLTELGGEQHAAIAGTMCTQFPEVFEKGGKVLARASTSQRAITSMTAFCVSLQKNAPKLDITANSLHTNMIVANPTGAPKEILERYEGMLRMPAGNIRQLREKHYDDITGRLFSDKGFLEDMGGRSQFLGELFSFWAGYHNYCEEDLFEDIFTEEEILDFWEVENYNCYTGHSGNRYQTIPLLRDIIECADEAIATGEYKGHFRFGHDTVVNAVVPLLNLNGCGTEAARVEDVKYWFQNYNCPMAANFQFIFYRSKKNPEILFKVLLNNAEAALPQLDPVSGPYYKWDDFKAWAEKVYAEHPLREIPVSHGPVRAEMML